MIIEPAGSVDIEPIVGLERWFPEGQRWSGQAWREELAAPDRLVLVARVAQTGEVIGAATFQVVGDVADLHRIVVAGPHRRRGLARGMLMTGMHWAMRAGADRMLLEVRTDNDGALGLYEDYGFRRVAERRDYYAPGAHAAVLERRLHGVDADSIGPWRTREAS